LVKILEHRTNSLGLYLRAVIVVVLCTLTAAAIFPHLDAANLSMLYLAGIVVVALYYGRGPSMLATILSVAAFDILFTEPYGSFAIKDVQYVFTLLVMLLVAITVSTLALRSRRQTQAIQEQEHRTASLYTLNRKFSNAQGMQELATLGVRHVAEEFHTYAKIYIPDSRGTFNVISTRQEQTAPSAEIGIAEWAYNNGQIAGHDTGNLPGSDYLYIPLRALQNIVGVLAVFAVPLLPSAQIADREFLHSVADQIALAIERISLTEEAQQARMQAETERLRSNLLSSVSHDLRTPLSSIMGAASTLREKGITLDPKTHDELSQLAYEEAQRLNRLVGNLLDMTRLESGGLRVEKEWQTLEEVIGAALHHLGKRRKEHPIVVNLPSSMPLVPMDIVLIEQVFLNLLENAFKYTPEGTPIELSAESTEDKITVEVADQGPGIVPGDEGKIFEKFYRSNTTSSGAGLGLTICKGIIEAHRGKISARNRPSGGAIISFTLPLEGKQPSIDEEA
jgi:two-component system, OmpR family, sensor histidine kinase KdpD